MAKGLDCGTSFYIAATEDTIKKQRNAFLTVDGEVTQVKRMLKRIKRYISLVNMLLIMLRYLVQQN